MTDIVLITPPPTSNLGVGRSGPWRTNVGGLGVVPVAAAAAAAPKIAALLQKIKPIAQVAEKIGSLVAKLGIPIGGVTQDRFFERYYQIKDIFKAAGYPVEGARHDELLTQFKIRKTQVKDRKSDNYHEEFQRLRLWVIQMLNDSNPGLGDLYAQFFQSFPMMVYSDGKVSNGQMASEPIEALKDFVTIKPGTYDPAIAAKILAENPSETPQAVIQQAKEEPLKPSELPSSSSASSGLLIGGGVLAAAISFLK